MKRIVRSRKMAPVVSDDRVATVLPAEMLTKLPQAFVNDLCAHPHELPAGISEMARAYFRLVFCLIFYEGLAGPDAWLEITNLLHSHTRLFRVGVLYIPRRGGTLPIRICPLTQLCLLGLFHRIALLDTKETPQERPLYDTYLVPERADPEKPLEQAEIRTLQDGFVRWITELIS